MKAFCRVRSALAAMVCAAALWSGCESSSNDGPYGNEGGSGSSSGGNAAVSGSVIVGMWELVDSGGSSWYVTFSSDGTWKITDDRAGNALRVYGTYKVSGSEFSGDMENPGVGTGEIKGTISADGATMDFRFIEHWHSPYKEVVYTGTKL